MKAKILFLALFFLTALTASAQEPQDQIPYQWTTENSTRCVLFSRKAPHATLVAEKNGFASLVVFRPESKELIYVQTRRKDDDQLVPPRTEDARDCIESVESHNLR
ncbi:MAG TPA: hypothetical protein VFM02_00760 [Candidatus Paceibacterota bacterium]|nr:hypothetical protein [Candidatus Paceibacterota bacterium]